MSSSGYLEEFWGNLSFEAAPLESKKENKALPVGTMWDL